MLCVFVRMACQIGLVTALHLASEDQQKTFKNLSRQETVFGNSLCQMLITQICFLSFQSCQKFLGIVRKGISVQSRPGGSLSTCTYGEVSPIFLG